ncbi:putative zinc finger protein [Orchesella cincta]|uniref:Putative zinc finger protein n=1 Tax=Orchesella cincta TaxID=48709 RepID=A0A1D2MDG0_ORCCI|nr:putative zinc finger protein [Orchesella cincta]
MDRKIEASKNVENEDFVWGKIREEALKGFNQVATEKYNVLIVKTESEPLITTESHNQTKYPDEDDYKFENGGITNQYQHEEDEENVDFSEEIFDNDDSHSSYQPSSSSINQMTDDDDEEEEIKFVTDFDPSDFQPSRTNCTNFPSPEPSNSNISSVSRAYFYACHQCSYQSNTKAGFEAHQRLHAEGSGAVTCRVCGRPVLPKMMARHNASHPVIGAYRQRKRAKTVLKNGARPLELGTTPGSTSSNAQTPGKYYYRCIQCPYENNSSLAFEIHSKLHEEGSGAVICGECGLYVDPKRMAFHRTRRHNYSNGSYVKKKSRNTKHTS